MTFGRMHSAMRVIAVAVGVATWGFLGTPATKAYAQQSALQGRVVDVAGAPLGSVDVSIPELSRGTRTNSDGHFGFEGIAAGTRTVVFSRAGFATESRSISIPAASALDITLKASPLRLSALTVTATREPIVSSASPLSTATLDAEQLRRLPTVSLSHALDRLAGVHTLATGQEIGKPVIRGVTGPRVLVLDNGHRLEDYSWSDEDGPSIDARQAERVELVRGPASVLYGSEAMGGVVNAVPAPLPNAIGRSPFTRYGVEIYGATNNREGGTVLRAEGAKNAFGYRAIAIGRMAEAIHTPAGELENTGFMAVNGELAGGFQGTWGNAALRVARYGGEFKLLEARGESPVGGIEPEGEEEGGPVRKLGDNRVQLDFNRILGGMRLETKAQWQMHELAEVEEEGEGGGEEEGEIEGLELVLNTLSLDVLLHHSLAANTTGLIGVTGIHQTNDTRGLLPFIPDASRSSFALYGLEQWTRGALTLVGSARGDLSGLHTDGNAGLALGSTDRDFNAFTYSAGAVVKLAPAVSVTGNIGRAWRAPNFFELFANGPQLGEGRYVIGSTAMQEEHSTNFDASVRIGSGRLHGEVAGFSNSFDGYIYLQPTGQSQDSLGVFRYQQADAKLHGGEATAELEVLPSLTIRGRADYVRGTNEDTNEPLPLIPPVTLEAGAELHGSFAGLERAYLEADVEHHADPKHLNSQDTFTDGYDLLTVGAGFDRRLGHHDLRIDLRVHNATNESYRDFLYRYKEFALNPGRDIMLRASLDF